MGNFQGTHITGNGHQELQFFLFHKLVTDPATSHEAQFYYNTVDKTVLIYDSAVGGAGWKYIPKIEGAFTTQQLLVGDGFFIKPITAPVGTSFVLVDENATPSFVSINSVFTDNILNYDGVLQTYRPYTTKKLINPGYAYFYEYGTGIPSYNNAVTLDGGLELISVNVVNSNVANYAIGISPSTLSFNYGYTGYNINGQIQILSDRFLIQALRADGLDTSMPIYIGANLGSTHNEHIIIDDANQLFNINMTTTRLSKGTANTLLGLGNSKEITYNTLKDGVFNLDISSNEVTVSPYSVKTISCFYVAAPEPTSVSTVLSYDGIFRATRLYEGTARVMTSHGNQTANGSLHAITNVNHAGFVPALPLVQATSTFLRGDGTWASTGAFNYWQRTGTEISPLTEDDNVKIINELGWVNIDGPRITFFEYANNSTGYIEADDDGGLLIESANIWIGNADTDPAGTYIVVASASNLIEVRSVATRIGENPSTNYSEFERDGTLVFHGSATVFNDLYPSSVTLGSGRTAPGFTAYNGNLYAYEFVGSGAVTKQLNMGFQLSHMYKEGTDIEPHIHLYVPDDVTGGRVKFYMEYTWTNHNQVGVVATTTVSAYTVRTASQGINNNLIISFGLISGVGKEISSMFMCRIYRDPADVIDGGDTFTPSVWLKSADIHIECDTVGSRSEYLKPNAT